MDCAAIVLVLLNLLVFIAGGTVLIAGLLLKFASGILDSDVLSFLNEIEVDSVPLGTIADSNAYMMMIGGVIIMVIGITGLCGAWNDIKECLWCYIVIVVILVLLQVTVVGLWIYIRQSSDDWFKGKLLGLLDDYEGPEAEDIVSKGWNTLFMKAECCGVNSQYKNGGNVNDFRDRPSKWWTNKGSDNLPATCCQGCTSDTKKEYIGSDKCAANVLPINFYETGCYDRITGLVDQYSMIIIIVVAVIFFVQVTAIVCACSLLHKNQVESFETKKDHGSGRAGSHPAKTKFERY